MEIFAEHEKIEQLSSGYKLIRRSWDGKKPVIAIGASFNEIGFEMCSGQSIVRTMTLKAQREGKHVIVLGWNNRHQVYDSCDEFWGICDYRNTPNTHQSDVQLRDNYKTAIEWIKELDHPDDSKDSLKVFEASEKAKKKAKEIGEGCILLLPRFRTEECSRNFDWWPALTSKIKNEFPKRRLINCSKPSYSYKIDAENLFDLLPQFNSMDVEIELYKTCLFALGPDSGSTMIPVLSGCRRLILFNGMYPMHVIAHEVMKARFPKTCANIEICDNTHVYHKHIGMVDIIFDYIKRTTPKDQ